MTPDQRERYSRQIRFKGLGEAGQERLMRSTVAVVGCGALGSFQAGAMARAGVRKLILIDRDYLESSNLQRQWLYDEADAGQSLPKALAAAAHLREINSDCEVESHVADLTPGNIEDLLHGCDVILDGCDNFETRYLINDYAVSRGVPWVYGGAVGSYGIVMPVVPGETACLACVYPQPPGGTQPTCETAGVLNAVTSLVASLQCAEATKILVGAGPARRITTVDVWTGTIRQIDQPARDGACRACGARQFDYLDARRRVPVSLCGRNAVQIHERTRPLDLLELRKQLADAGEVRANEFALRFFPTPYEMTVFPDGRAIIKGTTDIGVARSLYARYIGA
ncbi:MAG TPA: ThiF family adenylyltransferase [Bryobacteraceae bacterium]|nr:ThiF family adenylyltransferase [Bryobacteraceae bacterium]